MATEWRYLLPAPLRRIPADLAFVVGWTVATVLVVALPVVSDSVVRYVVGVPFLVFLPGYAFVSLLFPELGDPPVLAESERSAVTGESTAGVDEAGTAVPDSSSTTESRSSGRVSRVGSGRGIDGVERVALSFGLSIAIVPMIGLALNFTPWGIRLWPFLTASSIVSVSCAIGAAVRRRSLPPEERYFVPYRAWLDEVRGELLEPADRTDAALNVLLVASVLLALGSVGFAVAVPSDGEQFTEFYVLTDSGDQLVAGDYPGNLTAGDTADVVLGVGNREHERVEYTVVAQLQRAERTGNRTRVVERTELDQSQLSLDHGQTVTRRHNVTLEQSGDDLRVKYLLYRGSPPLEPTADNAYRDLHLWMDVVPDE